MVSTLDNYCYSVCRFFIFIFAENDKDLAKIMDPFATTISDCNIRTTNSINEQIEQSTDNDVIYSVEQSVNKERCLAIAAHSLHNSMLGSYFSIISTILLIYFDVH